MTFLEFVARTLMGPPVCGRMWHCPFHNDRNPSFSIRPPKAGYEVKYKCWGCEAWGDEMDLLKLFYPREGYGERLERRRNLWMEYVKTQDDGDNQPTAQPPLSLPSGKQRGAKKPVDPGAVCLAFNDLQSFLRQENPDHLELLVKTLEVCRENRCTVESLVKYWRRFERWIEQTDREHRRTCNDPDCEAIVCREARGLPPLSAEELKAQRPLPVKRFAKKRGR